MVMEHTCIWMERNMKENDMKINNMGKYILFKLSKDMVLKVGLMEQSMKDNI